MWGLILLIKGQNISSIHSYIYLCKGFLYWEAFIFAPILKTNENN
jgi:hypothetical protein